MGSDFRCRVETSKIVWVIGLTLASVLIIQYFEIPYRDSMISLFYSSKSYFSPSNNADIGKQSCDLTSIPEEYHLLENSTKSIGISTITTIAPERSKDRSYTLTKENNGISDNITSSVITFTKEDGIAPNPSTRNTVVDTNNSDPMTGGISRVAPSPSTSLLDGFSSVPMVSPSQPSPPPVKRPESPVKSVVSMSEMNDMLIRSRHNSSYSKSPLWPSAADKKLLEARFEIEHSPIIGNHSGLYAPIYRNVSVFLRSYEIMEQKLKIYIYKDGKRPIFHQPRLKGIYASEGWFMKQLQLSNRFVTGNPDEAHLFYLPFSSKLLAEYVYVRDSHTFDDINEYLKNYIKTIKKRYKFWNRTDGGDHFLVACHDWAPIETRQLMSNCIRALCNSDIKEGFQFGRDVSLPETNVHSPQNPSKEIGGSPPSKRRILAFFAGQMHGYVRPILLKHWENKDPDMKIVGRMRKGYVWHMKNSKYCICAKGYEVNSPRVVEAITYGCVPVIISDGFVPSFFDILKWETFAVFVLERDIPNLKDVLVSIPNKRYVLMQRRVEMARRHFLWHNKPEKYDIFHMILHSVWYNRVLQTVTN